MSKGCLKSCQEDILQYWGIPNFALYRSAQTPGQQPEAMLKAEAEENPSASLILLYQGEDAPSVCCWDVTCVASSGWRWVLLRAAWMKGHSTGCNETHGHLALLVIWAADLGFLGELQTEHILLPSSP